MADPAWLLLVGTRLTHYAAVTLVFGAALFPLYGGQGLPKRAMLIMAWTALLTTVAWFLATIVEMSGDVAAAFAPDTLGSVLKDMAFGHLFAFRILLAGLVLWAATGRARPAILATLSAALLASLAGVGHTQLRTGLIGLGDVAADAFHLLAAGAWIGGLVPLAALAASHHRDSESQLAFGQILQRFSQMGYLAVATLVTTGLFNSWRLVGSVSNLATTPYGRLLMVKLTLFLAMLALAAVNRLWISPPLQTPGTDPGPWLSRLKRHIAAEQILAVLILAVVSWLGAIEPAA